MMRRHEKEIKDQPTLRAVIQQSMVCRLGLSDGYQPYVVPLSFGYEDGYLYFHAAHEGRKIEIIRRNNSVCFEFDANTEIVENEEACDWGMRYKSVIGFGKAIFIEDIEEKRRALKIIMKQYSNRSFSFPEQSVASTTVLRVEIESMVGKQSGY
ncbi:flavin nucleotide-binding protein, putative [Geotalea daltonii FRC-32]|uniref:Flavin nucleotide-binding protein, putative n=1 Tax=Geotalea daltonii (strain DSM 22248 / JCM 15807 / FRC-32) TaxID=316067 RepID=B9M2G8_GEODF|nr:pyridoxamine 5'-phosphate oxidase family protein [Geotalea daltonii]ACM19347.1 flavin nucleotide-binding protein, putative [Geotalea daltonii FRC-32]